MVGVGVDFRDDVDKFSSDLMKTVGVGTFVVWLSLFSTAASPLEELFDIESLRGEFRGDFLLLPLLLDAGL